jgi:hypothetical protein
MLESHGSFLRKSPTGVADEARQLCKDLCKAIEAVPKDTPFRDIPLSRFARAWPGAMRLKFSESYCILSCLLQSGLPSKMMKNSRDSSGWSKASMRSPPKPDYCVGFKRGVFTDLQLQKLRQWTGNTCKGDTSLLMATSTMHFPFLACEVKCGREALDVADNQNAHSITIALGGMVQLSKLLVEALRLIVRSLALHPFRENARLRTCHLL